MQVVHIILIDAVDVVLKLKRCAIVIRDCMLRCKILFQVPLVDSAAGDELVVLFRLFQLLLLFLLIFWA